MSRTCFFAFVFVQVIAQISGEVYYTKLHQDENFSCTILSSETRRIFKGFQSEDENALHVSMKPAMSGPADSMLVLKDHSKLVEIFARKQSVVDAHVNYLCKATKSVGDIDTINLRQSPEIQKIVDGGDQSNRIDVVFMGDGYTASERTQFFDDMNRLTTEMFEGVTFKSYLPVFNIWAIYVESQDSGIGYNGPKNTPFQLYREAGQLRGIFPGDSNNARVVCRLTGTGGCDYPSIIGNDDFYGGLGGEFVISTKSNRTGTVVLRHEMGHNFVDVGEEYDNGQVYSGVNAARTLATLGWTSWLTGGTPAREERAVYRLLEYPWADLSRGDQSFSFNSDGTYNRWYLLVSVSAAAEEESLEFLLDGEVLPWATRGFDDREFYSWSGGEGFSSGRHTFSVRSKTASTNPDIPRMICSITLHEFGSEEEFNIDNNVVSAYPTWSVFNSKTYRPTNAGCLMRNMTHSEFCPVCKEGMWYQFLQRISLIDSVDVADTTNPDGTKTVTLNTLKLGQLRDPSNAIDGETLEITWTQDSVVREDLNNQFTVDASSGSWRVEVSFKTPEVRSDPQNLLTENQAFTV